MAIEDLSKEEQILRAVKRILTDVAKETHTRPGMLHPLSEATIRNMRDCLAMIAEREAELAQAAGRPMNMRPRFIDEPQAKVAIPLDEIGGRKKH